MAQISLDWAEKYRPATLSGVLGNDAAVSKLSEWARTWPEHPRPALLSGPPGVGKTSAALALAADMGWETVELNASDQRTASAIQQVAGEAALSGTFAGAGGRRMVILDEADNLHGNYDRGGVKAISDLVGQARQPVLLIANDPYALPRGLRDKCEEISFRPLREASVQKVLQRICEQEGVACEPQALSAITSANRELRGAINDLQAAAAGRARLRAQDVAPTLRDTKESLFEVMRLVFQGDDPRAAHRATYDLDESPEDLVHWVDENLPVAYRGGALLGGYRSLSRADVFLGRVRRRQSYRLWRYASVLMSAGVNLAKEKPFGGYLRYQPPQHWMLLGRTRGQRALRDAVARKLAQRYHCAPREALRDLLPYLRLMLADDPLAVEVCARLELEPEEVAFLLGSKRDSARVRRVHEAAELLRRGEREEHIAAFGGFGVTSSSAPRPGQRDAEDGGAADEDAEEVEVPEAQVGRRRDGEDGAGEGGSEPKSQRTLFEY